MSQISPAAMWKKQQREKKLEKNDDDGQDSPGACDATKHSIGKKPPCSLGEAVCDESIGSHILNDKNLPPGVVVLRQIIPGEVQEQLVQEALRLTSSSPNLPFSAFYKKQDSPSTTATDKSAGDPPAAEAVSSTPPPPFNQDHRGRFTTEMKNVSPLVEELCQEWVALAHKIDPLCVPGGPAATSQNQAEKEGEGWYPGCDEDYQATREGEQSSSREERSNNTDSGTAEVSTSSPSLPPAQQRRSRRGMKPTVCLFNLYDEQGSFKWHIDGEHPEDIMNNTGPPIVSVTIGNSCEFGVKPSYASTTHSIITLHSGDVLLFGGPARAIVHSALRMLASSPSEATVAGDNSFMAPPKWPKELVSLPQGLRLNITLRDVRRGTVDKKVFPLYRVKFDERPPLRIKVLVLTKSSEETDEANEKKRESFREMAEERLLAQIRDVGHGTRGVKVSVTHISSSTSFDDRELDNNHHQQRTSTEAVVDFMVLLLFGQSSALEEFRQRVVLLSGAGLLQSESSSNDEGPTTKKGLQSSQCFAMCTFIDNEAELGDKGKKEDYEMMGNILRSRCSMKSIAPPMRCSVSTTTFEDRGSQTTPAGGSTDLTKGAPTSLFEKVFLNSIRKHLMKEIVI